MKRLFAMFALVTFAVVVGSVAAPAPSPAGQDVGQYVPVLPEVVERMYPVDPAKGYLVEEIAPRVFILTDGVYQSMFVTTGEGVILFDAPTSLAAKLRRAVAEVTDEPIRKLVYSHSHVDHIAGSEVLRDLPGLEIIAEQQVHDFLVDMDDPRRLLPTTTFVDRHEIRMGTAQVELEKAGFHSNEGDLYVYLPNEKVLMAVDTFAPGYVPFMNFDLTTNVHEYLEMFDELLAYDFEVLVAGHLTSIGTRPDVVANKEYTMDVYRTVKRIHNSTDEMAAMMEVIEEYGPTNVFLIFDKVLEGIVQVAYEEIKGRWIDRLAGVDVFGESHVRTMLIYVRWEDKL